MQVFRGKENPITLDWNRVRVFDRDVGQMFVNFAKSAKEAQVRCLISVGHNNTFVSLFMKFS